MRSLAAATAAVAVCTVLAGCTTSGRPEPTPSPSPSPSVSSSVPATPQPVTLRFAVFGDKAAIASYRQLAEAYTVDHPEVTIKVESAADAAAASGRLEQQLAAEDPPDLFLVDHDDVPGLVRAGDVQPVDELLEKRGIAFGDNYQRIGLEGFSADSALQCMPHDVSPLVVYYNKRLVDLATLGEEGQEPPNPVDGWTWDQFAAAARNAAHGRVKGLYVAPTLQSLIPLVRSAGADVVDDDRSPTTLTMSDGDTRAALEQVLTLARDRQVAPSRTMLERQDAATRFARGRIAMMIGTRELTPQLRKAEGLQFDVMPLPSLGRPTSLAVMSGYCIAAGSQHVDSAADFLAFATSTRGAIITTESGYFVPANLEVLHSRTFLQGGQQPGSAEVFGEAVRRSGVTPFSPAWPEVVRETEPLVEQLFYAPAPDLDILLPRMDEQSKVILTPPSSSGSPSPSP